MPGGYLLNYCSHARGKFPHPLLKNLKNSAEESFALIDPNDFYAVGVAMVGDTAYLHSASAVAMLNLAPTDLGLIHIESARGSNADSRCIHPK